MSTPDANGHPMHGPKWKWEWSPNTIAIVLGIGVTLASWSGSYALLNARAQTSEESIQDILTEIKRIDQTDRTLDSHEIRLTAVERRQGEATTDMRGLEIAINELSSDVRLTREILQRLERSIVPGAPR